MIQKHDATRLHYDLRLEMSGAFKSWAVPKGLPWAKGEKRLAVHVEDHPLAYGNFEGTIYFVSPEILPGADKVQFWFDVDNPDRKLRRREEGIVRVLPK